MKHTTVTTCLLWLLTTPNAPPNQRGFWFLPLFAHLCYHVGMNPLRIFKHRREVAAHKRTAELVPSYGAFLAKTAYEDTLANIIYLEAQEDPMLYSLLWRAYRLPDRIRIPAGIFMGEVARQVIAVNEQTAFWAGINACRKLWPND